MQTKTQTLTATTARTSASLLLLALALTSACTRSEKGSASGTASNSAREPSSESNTIKIGEVGSMTGSEATFGVSTHQGIDLAIKQINAGGGIKGKKVEVISLDDQSKPDEAATAVTKLITQEKVTAVLGEVASSRSLAMAAIAQDHKIPMVTPSSTNPKVTEIGNFIFRVCFIDPFQGEVMAKFASRELKLKRVAILKDMKSDYSTGLSEFFKKSFTSSGGTITAELSYSSGDIDFKSQLTAIKKEKPEAVFVPGYYTEVGLIARQAKEMGITAPLLGGDGWDSPKLTEIAGSAIENSYFSNHYSNENQAPHIQQFINEFKKTYGVMPDGLSAAAYDATKVLASAMGQAKTMSTEDIRSALALTKDYQGVTGNISIDSLRNAVKSAVVLKVAKNGDFKYETTIHP